MRRWGDVEGMISEPAIDKRTEEKMFFGTLAPEDAPPEFARVAALFRAASLPRTQAHTGSLITDTEKLRQQHVVAAMASVIAAAPEGLPGAAPGHTFSKAMSALRPERVGRRRRGRARLVLVMALGMMIAGAGMAFAGVLPSPMQHAASVLFSKVGVHVSDGGASQGTGPGKEPGSSSGHEKVAGSGDRGNGKDLGRHTGQERNGNRGLHKGLGKDGHEGNRGHQGGASNNSPAHAGQGSGNGGGSHDSNGGGASSGGGDASGNNGVYDGGHSGHDSLTLSTP
jgi:hypothetical protein